MLGGKITHTLVQPDIIMATRSSEVQPKLSFVHGRVLSHPTAGACISGNYFTQEFSLSGFIHLAIRPVDAIFF